MLQNIVIFDSKCSTFACMCAASNLMQNLMLQVARQLEKARAEVSNAEAASCGHASALSDKERQKKWMKF